jgi:predicted Fe-Mo cluster-binding NifX family protein
VGISGSPHKTEDSSVLLTYAASILTTGQNEKINVTVTDKVPDEMMQKLKQMGIDPKRIKVIHDTDNTVTESRANRIFKPAAV